MPTLYPAAHRKPPANRISRTLTSPVFDSRGAAVDALKPRRRFGIDPEYTQDSPRPHAYDHVFRDASDQLIPERPLKLYGFGGTKPVSKRTWFRRRIQTLHLKELGIAVGPDGQLEPLDRARAAALYPGVAHLVTEQGDLRQTAYVAVYCKALAPKSREILIQRGCFGSPVWHAMHFACIGCVWRSDCRKVVDYRLTFGGQDEFDRSYDDNWDFDRREWMKRVFDRAVHFQSNQGFQRLKYDPDIRKLLSVYTGLWYLSDRAAGERAKDAKWDDDAPRRTIEAADKAEVRARHDAEVADRVTRFQSEARAAIEEAVADGWLQRRIVDLANFFAENPDRRWRKRRAASVQIAAVDLAGRCVSRLIRDDATYAGLGSTKQICELANVALSLSASGASETVTYNATDRHLKTIVELEAAGSY